jgi:hypothetical protein
VEDQTTEGGNVYKQILMAAKLRREDRGKNRGNRENSINLLKPTGYMMHQQFIHQLHALPILYLCVSYLSENKQ